MTGAAPYGFNRGEDSMRKLTRRTMLTGAATVAATALAPFSGIDLGIAQELCRLRSRSDFLAEARQQLLTGPQRQVIVEQGIKLLQEFYSHLPIKQKLYNVDPVKKLQELHGEALQLNSDEPFHARMTAIFTELRDLHTRYRPPAPYGNAHAFLPFSIEACSESGQPRYIVTRVINSFTHPTFRPGVEVVGWNGVPIEQAIERAGVGGATASAQQGLGLARLTYRALQLEPIPDDESVTIRYRTGGQELDVQAFWQVVSMPGACAVCNEVQQIQEIRKVLFAPYDLCDDPIRAELHTTPGGDQYGYVRIFSFPTTIDQFVANFRTAVAQFTNTKGLIVDVRDNGGGSIRASERILQWVAPTPGPIEPSKLYFRASQMTLAFCKLPTSVKDLGPQGLTTWIPSVEQALQTGTPFSDAFEYTKKGDANDPTRVVFPRPVIVVTSGLTYSSAEFFTAGFQDHGGKVLGVDKTTGGGGANFRNLTELNKFFRTDNQPLPFAGLPNGADFQLAFRRAKRVGGGAGKEIEDAGIECNFAHAMTRNDLLNKNQDLKNHAANLLAQMK
jgi:C-terminal processing protease CtpA/Prc